MSGRARSLFPVSGSDYFHLLVDGRVRPLGQPGNVSRIHLLLDDGTDLTALQERLSGAEVLAVANRVKLVQRPFRVPQWELSDSRSAGQIALHQGLSEDEFNRTLLQQGFGPGDGMARIDLCHWADGSKHALVSLRHALFDHVGIRQFLSLLSSGGSPVQLFPSLSVPLRFWQEMAGTLRATAHALGHAKWRIAQASSAAMGDPGHVCYRIVRFSEEETAELAARLQAAGLPMGHTALWLAASTGALCDVLRRRGQPLHPWLWLTIPHDMRRKGGTAHLLSNDLSFLFFQLRTADCSDTPEAMRQFDQQLRQQVRDRLPAAHASLMRTFRHLPAWLCRAMMDLSAGGAVSSLALSDLGRMGRVEQFAGCGVREVRYLPPVFHPPGISLAVMYEGGALAFTLGYFSHALTEQEAAQMAEGMRARMRGA